MSPRTNIRRNYSWRFRTIGEREECSQRTTVDELANKCQRLIEVGIKCGDKPWPLADRKTVSLLYLSIRIEGRCILNYRNPHIMIDTLTTVDFWKIMEEAFIRRRNINFDRHIFLITKQLRVETVEHFYGNLKELAENCDFGNKQETLIRDVFITNVVDPEIQRELPKQTVEPHQVLELRLTWNSGCETSIKISSITRLSSQLTSTQFNSLVALEPRIGKIRIMIQDKTTAPHSTVQTVQEFGYQIIVINVSQKVKFATIVNF